MRRRQFIVLGSAAMAWPRAARAQQRSRIPRVGIVDDAPIWDAFRQSLHDLGYVESQSIAFEYRTAQGEPTPICFGAARPTCTKFCKAPNPQICRWSSR